MGCCTPGFPVLHYLLEFAQRQVHWVGGAIQPSHPLLSPSIFQSAVLLPSVFPSIRVFSNESALRIRWPKYWSFIISPSNEYSGLISFRMDWLDLLAVQESLKSLLQHYSSKASILQHSAFFVVQLSHAYVTTGKTIALTTWTFVGKEMSLLFNMLSRFVTYFLSKRNQWLFVTPRTVAHQCPLSMDFPGNSTGVDCHFLLQWIFPTQGWNPGLPHCRQTLYRLSYQGS